jgi:predicted dinucleotide-binding enzyme
MTTIGILGTGRMGVRLAQMFAQAGQSVILGSRDLARATRIVDALKLASLTPGRYEDAAQADVILPAMLALLNCSMNGWIPPFLNAP